MIALLLRLGVVVNIRISLQYSAPNIFNLLVQDFDGLVWIKWLFKLGVVVFQIIGVDHAIGGNEVVDDVKCGGIGVPSVAILKCIDVCVIDSSDELLFEGGVNIPVQGEGVVVELVLVGDGGNLGLR